MTQQCIVCNKNFIPNTYRKQKCCSKECKSGRDLNIRRGLLKEIKCETCGIIFQSRGNLKRFCSKQCNKKKYHQRKRTFYRNNLFIIYGDKCACCGEKQPEFLTLEHKNGDGRKHRNKCPNVHGTWRDAIENIDHDRFEILCMNCNWAKGKFGECPHKREVI